MPRTALLLAGLCVATGLRFPSFARRAGRALAAAPAPVAAAPAELRTRSELKEGIAGFYDSSSAIWEKVWGEHMHHGYYGDDKRKDHVQAQVDMVDETLAWAGVDGGSPPHTLDVGCGIGGSSRHIARKYGGTGVGITLSPVQAARANALSADQGLGGRLDFEVADALAMPFADDSFDLVWSMESGEHMPDKRQFVKELARVCKPGGRIIVVAWCHRDLAPGEAALAPREERLLRTINRAYYLPRWCSVADYVGHAAEHGLHEAKTADWTEKVKRFWPAVMLSALRPRALWGLLRSGASTVRGALVMPLMIRGQKKGTIKFGLLTATKPAADPEAWVDAAVQAVADENAAAAAAKPSAPSPMMTATAEPEDEGPEPEAEAEAEDVPAVAATGGAAEGAPPAGFEWGATY